MNKNNYIVNYINLDNRQDRKEHIEKELLQIFPENLIVRTSAIKDKIGAIGCTKSHISVIENFLQSKYQYCFVFEDDFAWLYKTSEIQQILENIFVSDFNVVLLTYNSYTIQFKFQCDLTKYNLCSIACGLTTAGYIVNRKFADCLLENYKICLNKQLGNNNDRATIDTCWWALQTFENKFYASVPCLGTQYTNYSDIENQLMYYFDCNAFIVLILASEIKNVKKLPNCGYVYKYFVNNQNIYGETISVQADLNNVIMLDNYSDINAIEWVLNNYPRVRHIFVTNDSCIERINTFNLYSFYKNILKNNIVYHQNSIVECLFDKKLKKKKIKYHTFDRTNNNYFTETSECCKFIADRKINLSKIVNVPETLLY